MLEPWAEISERLRRNFKIDAVPTQVRSLFPRTFHERNNLRVIIRPRLDWNSSQLNLLNAQGFQTSGDL